MEISKSQRGNATILALKGAMISDTLDVFDVTIDECVSVGTRKIIIDLGNVPFIDSMGLEKILDTVSDMGKQGCNICVSSLNEVCREIFKVTLMENFILVYDNRESAIRSLL